MKKSSLADRKKKSKIQNKIKIKHVFGVFGVNDVTSGMLLMLLTETMFDEQIFIYKNITYINIS